MRLISSVLTVPSVAYAWTERKGKMLTNESASEFYEPL